MGISYHVSPGGARFVFRKGEKCLKERPECGMIRGGIRLRRIKYEESGMGKKNLPFPFGEYEKTCGIALPGG